MKYRGKCSGMEDHFDTGGVFEISKFDIWKFACTCFKNFCPPQKTYSSDGLQPVWILINNFDKETIKLFQLFVI